MFKDGEKMKKRKVSLFKKLRVYKNIYIDIYTYEYVPDKEGEFEV